MGDFGNFLTITEVAQILGLRFFPTENACNNFDKNLFGSFFDDFFTNSSGHPDCWKGAKIFTEQAFLPKKRGFLFYFPLKVSQTIFSKRIGLLPRPSPFLGKQLLQLDSMSQPFTRTGLPELSW
jgi:hypothetical protein